MSEPVEIKLSVERAAWLAQVAQRKQELLTLFVGERSRFWKLVQLVADLKAKVRACPQTQAGKITEPLVQMVALELAVAESLAFALLTSQSELGGVPLLEALEQVKTWLE